MMPFFNWNWAGACGGHWADLDRWQAGLQVPGSSGLKWDCYSAGLQALDEALLCKSKKEGGSARASPVAAPMPKSVSF